MSVNLSKSLITSECVVPSILRGVRMTHSGDMVEVWHGKETPARACGFHAKYYAHEVFAAHNAQLEAGK